MSTSSKIGAPCSPNSPIIVSHVVTAVTAKSRVPQYQSPAPPNSCLTANPLPTHGSTKSVWKPANKFASVSPTVVHFTTSRQREKKGKGSVSVKGPPFAVFWWVPKSGSTTNNVFILVVDAIFLSGFLEPGANPESPHKRFCLLHQGSTPSSKHSAVPFRGFGKHDRLQASKPLRNTPSNLGPLPPPSGPAPFLHGWRVFGWVSWGRGGSQGRGGVSWVGGRTRRARAGPRRVGSPKIAFSPLPLQLKFFLPKNKHFRNWL